MSELDNYPLILEEVEDRGLCKDSDVKELEAVYADLKGFFSLPSQSSLLDIEEILESL